MSHSSKWTFKDKGFLLCKLQLTAFNRQLCFGFPSGWSDSDDFFLLARYADKQTPEMETRMTNRQVSWVVRNLNHTKPNKTLNCVTIPYTVFLKGDFSLHGDATWHSVWQLGCRLPFIGAKLPLAVKLWHVP